MADAPPGLAALMANSALPDAGRVVGFHVATHDEGDGVELRLEDVSRLLHGFPGEDKCRATLRVLVLAGWVTRTPGGRDHGDTFRWAGADRVGLQAQAKDSLPVSPPGYVDLGLGSSPTLSDSLGVHPQAKALPPPPILPTSSSSSALDGETEVAIEGQAEHLEGCRGALRDYLTSRVAPEHRHAYAMTVAGWVRGTNEAVWADSYGGHLQEGRAAVVADALNQLRSGDEVGPYFPGPPGDIRNLATKVRYLARKILGSRRDSTRRAADPKATTTPSRRTPHVRIES